MKRILELTSWLGLAAVCGCGENTPSRVLGDASTSHDSIEQACNAAEGGVACPEGMLCVAGGCLANVCGDGRRAGDEECDDGNQLVGDSCTPSCRSVPPDCGDTVVQAEEECDDGNWFDLDTCSNVCTVNVCGNGREDGDEECDDGNLVDTDHCTNGCQENRCRNGKLEPGEECDDGNTDPKDGCTNACVVVECGNGRVEGPSKGGAEECDDGNDVDDDACTGQCTANVCGNRRVDPGEVCDGDTSTVDCSDDCKTTTADTGCSECRAAHCSNYMDVIDLVSGDTGCITNPDQSFRGECSALVDCAHRNGCGFDASGLVAQCFCGSVELGKCQTQGGDGPCQQETYDAARTTVLGQVFENASFFGVPLGVASYLLQCEWEFCNEECGP